MGKITNFITRFGGSLFVYYFLQSRKFGAPNIRYNNGIEIITTETQKKRHFSPFYSLLVVIVIFLLLYKLSTTSVSQDD